MCSNPKETVSGEAVSGLAGLQKLSTALYTLSLIGIVLVPLDVLLNFLAPGNSLLTSAHSFLSYRTTLGCEDTLANVALPLRLGAMAFALVPALFMMWALYGLSRLFWHFRRGEVFTYSALAWIERAGVAMLASEVLHLALQVPVKALLSLRQTTGGHHEMVLSFGFSSEDIALLFAAACVLAVGRVMMLARRGAEEVNGFV